ncbi:MAG: aldo/keto reductase [Geodermatophilaceae bacterium]
MTPHDVPDLALSVGRIPLLGLGTWQLRGSTAREAVVAALGVGYRHIDTATMYRNESEIGSAVADSAVPRDDVFLDHEDPGRALLRRPTHSGGQPPRRWGSDAVDLWLAHWPPPDIVGAWQTMRDLRDDGLARAIGVSNFSPAQIDELIAATGEAPAVNQIRWSPSDFDPSRLEHSRAGGRRAGGVQRLQVRRADLAGGARGC